MRIHSAPAKVVKMASRRPNVLAQHLIQRASFSEETSLDANPTLAGCAQQMRHAASWKHKSFASRGSTFNAAGVQAAMMCMWGRKPHSPSPRTLQIVVEGNTKSSSATFSRPSIPFCGQLIGQDAAWENALCAGGVVLCGIPRIWRGLSMPATRIFWRRCGVNTHAGALAPQSYTYRGPIRKPLNAGPPTITAVVARR